MRRAARFRTATVLAALATCGVVASCSGGAGPSSGPHRTAGPTASPTSPVKPQSPGSDTGSWTTYAAGNSRLGVADSQPSLSPLRRAWTAHLDGTAVYGQPLIAFGRVFAVTEGDEVFALDARNGSVLWKYNLGAPLQNVASQAGCGNIDPLGITSTPVIDTATHTIYAVGEVSNGGLAPVHHELVGLDAYTGALKESMVADPPLPRGEDPVNLLQRAALTLANGRVYIGYGGNFGDCGRYHGWLVGLSVNGTKPAEAAFDTTPDSTGGAIWQGGGGPAADAGGALFVTTGNPRSGGKAPWSEAVLKLAQDLPAAPLAAYQDRSATDDEDLGSGDATLLPDGTLFTAGKTQRGFLLRQSDLSQVAPVDGRICGSDPDGGAAYDAATSSIYLPCRDGGIQQVDISHHRVGWRSGEANAAPILVDGELWAARYPDGVLQQLDPATGRLLQSVPIGTAVPNFASPAAALGLLVIGTTSGVTAFDGPSAPRSNQ